MWGEKQESDYDLGEVVDPLPQEYVFALDLSLWNLYRDDQAG